jgi:hypothetical protein
MVKYMCAEDSPTEFRTQTLRNLIGRSMIPRRVCHRPAVFFCHFRHNALSFSEGKIWRTLKKMHFNYIFEFLRCSKSRIALTLNWVILGMSVNVKLSSCRWSNTVCRHLEKGRCTSKHCTRQHLMMEVSGQVYKTATLSLGKTATGKNWTRSWVEPHSHSVNFAVEKRRPMYV